MSQSAAVSRTKHRSATARLSINLFAIKGHRPLTNHMSSTNITTERKAKLYNDLLQLLAGAQPHDLRTVLSSAVPQKRTPMQHFRVSSVRFSTLW